MTKMYCSNCGNAATSGLKYCKNCGGRLGKEVEDKDGTPGKMLDNVLTTLFLVVMFGLGILVGLAAVLLNYNIEPKIVMFISIAYLAAIFGICYTLLSQVPKLIDAKLKNSFGEREGSAAAEPQYLRPPTTNQLGEYHEPASVTDQTTRTLDELPVKR